jgi:hypothetical protein
MWYRRGGEFPARRHADTSAARHEVARISGRTGPSSENKAFGLSSCACILLAISSLEPIISERSMACFFCLPFVALTFSREEGR